MSDISPKATVLLIFEIKRYHRVIGSDWMSMIFSVFFFVCLLFFFLFNVQVWIEVLQIEPKA